MTWDFLFVYYSAQDMDKIAESCITFYTEVISSLCFGPGSPPEDELVEKLLETVFATSKGTDSTETCILTPFKRSPRDDVPVVRSFLLQLLLRNRYNKSSYCSECEFYIKILITVLHISFKFRECS